MKLGELYKKNMKRNAFLTGAAILAVAGIICRLLGLAFRIPLANIVGNFGMGLYQMVFPIYALLLIVSSAGIPIAISKMVARESSGGNHDECKRILRASVWLLGTIGVIFTVLLLVLSGPIARLQGNEEVVKIYFAIAPSIFLVCVISAFRGYFQGLQNMIPTAVSQIIEQFIKVAVGIVLALILSSISPEWAVFGAILAITVAEIFALVFLTAVYLKHRKDKPQKAKGAESDSKEESDTKEKDLLANLTNFQLAIKILKHSLPVTAMAAVFPLILVFDSLIVINLLQRAGHDNHVATQLFGISTGTVHTLINMPAVLGVAVATAVVPTVSSLLKQEKIKELRSKCALAVKLITLIALFFTLFYIAFSSQIINLLYSKAFENNQEHFRIATWLLKIEATMIMMMGISQVFTAMLQGAGRAKFPLMAIAIGGAAKIIVQLILLPTPVGIFAVSIGNVLCFAIAGSLNTWFALKHFKFKGNLMRVWWRFLILVGMYTLVLLGIALLMPEGKGWIIIGGAIAFAIYLALVWFLQIFSKEERKALTKGA